MDVYDALIVGARVAGATTAALLGDAGFRVLLVDRASFPSDTLSTHFFRGAGFVSVLDDLGLLDDVLALGSPRLVREYRYVDGNATYTMSPAQESGEAGFCLSVRRVLIDDMLVRRATRSPSVELLERTRVMGLEWDVDRVVGARLSGPDGPRTVRARIVIGADGRHSGVARAVEAPVERWDEAIRTLYYCYVRGFSRPVGAQDDGPEFSFLGDELAYVFPSDSGLACIALSLNLDAFRSLGDTREQRAQSLATLLERHAGLSPRWRAATMEGGWLGVGPEGNYIRTPCGPGWALVGDASQHQDPWTGFGMDCAGVHARALAQSLIAWWTGALREDEVLDRYRQSRDAHGTERYQATIQYGRDLSLPGGSSAP